MREVGLGDEEKQKTPQGIDTGREKTIPGTNFPPRSQDQQRTHEVHLGTAPRDDYAIRQRLPQVLPRGVLDSN